MSYTQPDGTGRVCAGPECQRPARGSSEYCNGHRQQVAKSADLLKLRAALGERHRCRIDDCGKIAPAGNTVCDMHKSRKRKGGSYDPSPTSVRGEALARFTKKVQPDQFGCWLWQGTLNNRGYGQFFDPARGGRGYAHRWSYLHYIGPIDPGLVVMHMCDVPACVNPAHLRLGTNAENMADMESKGRARTAACKWGHVWTDENTRLSVDANGLLRRTCRACKRASEAEARQRKKATP